MKEEALYYRRPNLGVHEASLVAVLAREGRDSPDLILDSSIFYPEGGGQPCDLGSLGGIPLAWVGEEGGRVVHRLAEALPPGIGPGARLSLVLDQGRRLDHSEQHSGQHLLSATCLRVLCAPTRSFHLGPESSTIDIDCSLPEPEAVREVESIVNQYIADNYSIKTHLCPPEDIKAFPLRRLPPAGEDVLRVVEIDGLDFTPCCGTHLASTGDLRLLLLTGAEKYKGLTRLSFLAGGRAVSQALESTLAARDVGRILGAGPQGLAEAAAKALARLKRGQGERNALLRDRAVLEARAALASAPGGKPLLFRLRDRDAEAATEGAKALSDLGGLGIFVSMDEMTVCAAGPKDGPDIVALLGPVAAAMGGRGGGRGAFFRASFAEPRFLEEFLAESMNILQN